MSNFAVRETGVAVPHYTWGTNYHIDGAVSRTYLEEILIPGLDRLPPGSQVADFGSGDGRLREKAPTPPFRHYIFRAFDREPDAVAKYNNAVARYNGNHMMHEYDRAEVADLTQADSIGKNRFDEAFLWRVLHGIPQRIPDQFGEENIHVKVLRETSQSLKPGVLYHVAARSERDWVAGKLRKQGFYVSGQMNDCYNPMREAFAGQPDVKDWYLHFFREGELAAKGREAGLEVAYELAIEEESGFPELRGKGPLSYDYVAFYKPTKE